MTISRKSQVQVFKRPFLASSLLTLSSGGKKQITGSKYTFMPLNIHDVSFLFLFNIAVQFHSLRLQAASLQKADKELESRETLKRLLLVAETLS